MKRSDGVKACKATNAKLPQPGSDNEVSIFLLAILSSSSISVPFYLDMVRGSTEGIACESSFENL